MSVSPTVEAGKARYFLSSLGSVQVAHNGTIVLLPLVILSLTDDVSLLGFTAAGMSLFDAVGTFLGTYLLKSKIPSKVLSFTLVARSIIFFIAAAGMLSTFSEKLLEVFVTVIFADAFFRGIADPMKHAVPLQVVGEDRPKLKRLNATAQVINELGNTLGPISIGILFTLTSKSEISLIIGTLYFLAYVFLKFQTFEILDVAKNQKEKELDLGSSSETKPQQRLNPGIVMTMALQACLSTYPIKAILPGILAVKLLNQPEWTAYFVACFGIGGFLGSFAFRKAHFNPTLIKSVLASAFSLAVFAWCFLVENPLFISLCIIVSMVFNIIARMSLLTDVQLRFAPTGVGLLRSTSNATSFGLRLVVGSCFKVGTLMTGLTYTGGVLSVFALGQILFSALRSKIIDEGDSL